MSLTTSQGEKTNWWTRPCGGFDVLKQAIPLVISSGSASLMNFTDRMFLMWDSADSMTASMQGGMLFWAVVSLPMAIAAFSTTFAAQYNGSQQYGRIGSAVWQGIWIGFILMPFLLLFYEPLTHIFVLFHHDEHIAQLESRYFYWMIWGSAAVISGESAAAFFRGRGKMRIEMYITLFCVVLNIVLDYVMIFGKFGFPAWGLAGAAIATVISQWTRFVLIVTLMLFDDWHSKKFRVIRGMKPDFPLFGRLLYFGTPTGIFAFIDTVAFTAFIMIIGGLGEAERNATTIAFTLNSFTFFPLTGIGIVVMSMVGNQIAANRPDLARRSTMTAFVISCAYSGIFGIIFLVLPDVLVSYFTIFSDPQELASIHDLAVLLIRFVAMYLFFDSASVIFCSTLRGAGDTFYIAKMVLVLAPLYPMFCFAGIYFFGWGILWCWTVLTFDILLYCVFFSLRYRSKVWESMRVIENAF